MGMPFVPLSMEQANDILKTHSSLERSQLQTLADEHAALGCCGGCLEDCHEEQYDPGSYCCCILEYEVHQFINKEKAPNR